MRRPGPQSETWRAGVYRLREPIRPFDWIIGSMILVGILAVFVAVVAMALTAEPPGR